jgi:hypothetical protein
MSGRPRAVLTTVTLAMALAAATGCVPEVQLPSDCDAGAVQRSASLADDRLDPQSIEVCRDQQVTLDVAVTQDGELHLHGYEEVPEQEFTAGDTVHLTFTAVRSGQYPFEVHSASGDEVEVGILTVHEP